MKNVDANRTSPAYELKDELARLCLPVANRDPNLRLAWVNSLCILFLIIGITGARRGTISNRVPPAIEEIIPTVIEPIVLPPQAATENQNQQQNEPEKLDAPRVVVVTPESPAINFSIPTIGSLVAPAALASPAPLRAMQAPAALKPRLTTLGNTGTGGERPQPPYPHIALEQAEQGRVTVVMSGDGAGNIVSVQLKESSGAGVLDRATLDFIKRHWTLPAGATNQLFETSITYQLETH